MIFDMFLYDGLNLLFFIFILIYISLTILNLNSLFLQIFAYL